MKKSNTILLLILLILPTGLIRAQNAGATESASPWNLNLGADLCSRYLWRGIELDGSRTPHIQPWGSLSFHSWEAGVWGSANTLGTYQEIDLYLKKSFGNLYVQVYDFFIPIDQAQFNFFDLDADSTNHAFEAGMGYSASESFPFSFFAGTTVYGFDEKKANGDIYYSSYLEASFDGKAGITDYSIALGMTPFEGFYSDGPALVNIGLTLGREIAISEKWSLPIQTSLMINPNSKKAWMALIISL